MTDVNVTLLDNTDTQDNDDKEANGKDSGGKTKKKLTTMQKIKLGFAVVIGAALIIGLIIAIFIAGKKGIESFTRKRKENDDYKKEGFSASNSISNEYDYVNSVIYATLGDLSGLEKINANAIAA